MQNKIKKVAVFTGNRAEFGLQYPILKELKKSKKLQYSLIVSGAHLDRNFGETLKEITNKGFKIHKKIIYFSSSTVYGYKGRNPYRETSNILNSDYYNKNKLNIEKHVIKNNGIVIRLSNVLGNNMRNKNIVSDIINQLNNDLINLNNQNAIIDFININDVCSAVEKLINANKKGIFNLGCGKSITALELAKKIIFIRNIKQKKIYSKLNKVYSYNVLNIKKIKNTINWEPKFDINVTLNNLCKIK